MDSILPFALALLPHLGSTPLFLGFLRQVNFPQVWHSNHRWGITRIDSNSGTGTLKPVVPACDRAQGGKARSSNIFKIVKVRRSTNRYGWLSDNTILSLQIRSILSATSHDSHLSALHV